MSPYLRELRARIGTMVLEVPTVSVAVQDERGRVLLVRHVEGDEWTTPGGMIDPYESPADAAVREVWEETGLAVELTRILGVFGGPRHWTQYGNGDRIAWVATLFAARVTGGTPRADGVETLEARFVGRDELDGLRCKPHLAAFLAATWNAGPAPWFEPPSWKPPGAGAPAGSEPA